MLLLLGSTAAFAILHYPLASACLVIVALMSEVSRLRQRLKDVKYELSCADETRERALQQQKTLLHEEVLWYEENSRKRIEKLQERIDELKPKPPETPADMAIAEALKAFEEDTNLPSLSADAILERRDLTSQLPESA
jgi:hypothetical protein